MHGFLYPTGRSGTACVAYLVLGRAALPRGCGLVGGYRNHLECKVVVSGYNPYIVPVVDFTIMMTVIFWQGEVSIIYVMFSCFHVIKLHESVRFHVFSPFNVCSPPPQKMNRPLNRPLLPLHTKIL